MIKSGHSERRMNVGKGKYDKLYFRDLQILIPASPGQGQSSLSKVASKAPSAWPPSHDVGQPSEVPVKSSVPRAAAVPPTRPRRITWPAKARASHQAPKNVVRLLWDSLTEELDCNILQPLHFDVSLFLHHVTSLGRHDPRAD